MQITTENLRRTTMEHHNPFRTYYIKPRGAERIFIKKKMPLDNFVPTLWPGTVKQAERMAA